MLIFVEQQNNAGNVQYLAPFSAPQLNRGTLARFHFPSPATKRMTAWQGGHSYPVRADQPFADSVALDGGGRSTSLH